MAATLFVRGSADKPVVQIIENPDAPQPHRSKGSIHAPGKGTGRQGNAKGEDAELEDPPLEPKPEEPPVILPDRDMEVGVLQVDGGQSPAAMA